MKASMTALLLIIPAILGATDFHSDCNSILANNGFVIWAKNPQARLRSAAKQAFDEGQALQSGSETVKLTFANGFVQQLRGYMLNIRRFLARVQNTSPRLESEATPRIEKIDAFLAALPSTMTYAKIEDVQMSFIRLQNTLKIQDFIRALRTHPEALNSSEVQALLQEVVVDGVEHSVRQVVMTYHDPLGWDRERPLSLESVLSFNLPGHEGVNSNFDETSDRVTINASYYLLAQLLREVITNGSEVSRRRHPQIGVAVYNWNLALATTRVRHDGNGDVRIEIEDFGFPDEYNQVTGVGNSSPVKNGTGIGRLRIYLLAEFMGYRIEHLAKADGSGSIVSVHVPAAHIVKTHL